MTKELTIQETTQDMGYLPQSTVNTCPCYHCLSISKCGVRQPNSPTTCKELQEWLQISSSE